MAGVKIVFDGANGPMIESHLMSPSNGDVNPYLSSSLHLDHTMDDDDDEDDLLSEGGGDGSIDFTPHH